MVQKHCLEVNNTFSLSFKCFPRVKGFLFKCHCEITKLYSNQKAQGFSSEKQEKGRFKSFSNLMFDCFPHKQSDNSSSQHSFWYL